MATAAALDFESGGDAATSFFGAKALLGRVQLPWQRRREPVAPFFNIYLMYLFKLLIQATVQVTIQVYYAVKKLEDENEKKKGKLANFAFFLLHFFPRSN